jgi:hypothetical protein
MESVLTEREIGIKLDMERRLRFIVNDPNMLDSDGNTPLILVNRHSYIQTFKYTKLLIKMGADVNLQDIEGRTVLHFAVLPLPNYKLVKYLLSVGANPLIKNDNGKTPYDLAIWYYDFMHIDYDKIVELLKDAIIRKIQNKQLRRMTRRRARTMRRLATAKSMLEENNPMSHMDNDTMSYLMSKYLM